MGIRAAFHHKTLYEYDRLGFGMGILRFKAV